MRRLLIIITGFLIASSAFADSIADIQKKWDEKFPEMAGAQIQQAPMQGLYMVMTPPRVYYIDAKVDYIFNGSILNANEDLKNETQPYLWQATSMSVEAMAPSMITFSPKGKVKHTVTVFTDATCTYCQLMHKEIKAYNDLGIEIRYLAWPRSPVGTAPYKLMESVWCAKDKQKALTAAKPTKAGRQGHI